MSGTDELESPWRSAVCAWLVLWELLLVRQLWYDFSPLLCPLVMCGLTVSRGLRLWVSAVALAIESYEPL